MKLRFIGGEAPDDVCVVFGLSFPVGQWVEVENPPAVLLRNPTFEVEAEAPAAVSEAPKAPAERFVLNSKDLVRSEFNPGSAEHPARAKRRGRASDGDLP